MKREKVNMLEGKCHEYDDIINLQNPTSPTHPRMSLYDRAAQFSPFAALTGHEEAIAETARLTEEKMELSEDEAERLNEKLREVQRHLKTDEVVPVAMTYFEPDEKKSGGTYVSRTGNVKRIDEYEHAVIWEDGTIIYVEQIRELSFLERF